MLNKELSINADPTQSPYIKLSIPEASTETPDQKGYQFGRCFNHLKKSAGYLSLLSASTLSFPLASYFTATQLAQNTELKMEARAAAALVAICLMSIPITSSIFIVKICCTALKKGCAETG